jgi:hypothetical protein
MMPTEPTGSPQWRPTQGASTSPPVAFVIAGLRIEDGHIVEITAFHGPGLFPMIARPIVSPLTHR